MRTLYEFARKVDTSLPHLQVRERIPDDIFNHLKIDTSTSFDEKEIWAFDYIRLRRNRITHSGGQSKGELADLIRQKGHGLQEFWDETLKNGLFGLNFQDEDTANFTQEEIFDFINILRHLTDKIDRTILSTLGETKIIETAESIFTSINKLELPRWGKDRSLRKFISYCLFEFNIKLTQQHISDLEMVK